ncbi:MAG: hypothetical protein IPL08_15175 [Saprospiraceae bacterium]|nr:hypothetical protein [Saprospiraceae bacterium]
MDRQCNGSFASLVRREIVVKVDVCQVFEESPRASVGKVLILKAMKPSLLASSKGNWMFSKMKKKML